MRYGYINPDARFSETKQRAILDKAGVDEIWVEGRNGETLKGVIKACRGDGDVILCAWGLRALGASRKAIREAVEVLEAKNAFVIDAETGDRSDRHPVKMFDAALTKLAHEINGLVTEGAAKGGRTTQMKLRDRRIPKATAEATWKSDKFKTDREAAAACGIGWSRSTCRTTFGPSGRPQGRRAKALEPAPTGATE